MRGRNQEEPPLSTGAVLLGAVGMDYSGLSVRRGYLAPDRPPALSIGSRNSNVAAPDALDDVELDPLATTLRKLIVNDHPFRPINEFAVQANMFSGRYFLLIRAA